MKRSGGFREDLKYTLDCEMWARAIKAKGGFVTSEVLAYYRTDTENQSRRLWRSGEALADIAKLNTLFANRYEGFNAMKARRMLMEIARYGEQRSLRLGDIQGARACREYWKANAPIDVHLRVFAKNLMHLASRCIVTFAQVSSKVLDRNSQPLG